MSEDIRSSDFLFREFFGEAGFEAVGLAFFYDINLSKLVQLFINRGEGVFCLVLFAFEDEVFIFFENGFNALFSGDIYHPPFFGLAESFFC